MKDSIPQLQCFRYNLPDSASRSVKLKKCQLRPGRLYQNPVIKYYPGLLEYKEPEDSEVLSIVPSQNLWYYSLH